MFDDYGNKMEKLENVSEIIQVIMHPKIEMLVEKRLDLKQKNLLTTDEVTVFIFNPVYIRDT